MNSLTLHKSLPAWARTERATLNNSLSSAKSYADWARSAKALDELSGRTRWKTAERSDLYDYALIRERLERLRRMRRKGDDQGLVYALEEGVHGDLGGMGKPMLYNKARFGTKQLIADYVEEVCSAFLHIDALTAREMGASAKLDFIERASRCFGRSALMFSSGGNMMYFHFGVAKSLLEQHLLPRVISGSSAGALVCGVIGTRTDEEMRAFFAGGNIFFGQEWLPNLFERFSGLRRLYGPEALEHTLDRWIPDLTFREAFEKSGRQISISVSPCGRHQRPRLLNAITSPRVLIRSAVRASCAIPGMFEPVRLQARNSRGKKVPYLNLRWVDGVFAADLPAKQLARLYGTNHYIVSYVNPFLLPMFRDHKLEGTPLKPLLGMMKGTALNCLDFSDRLIAKYLSKSSSVGLAHKLLRDMLAQTYVGDISILPQRRLISPMRVISPNTGKEIEGLLLDGERQTWPRMEMVRLSSKISRTLDEILSRRKKPEKHPTRLAQRL